MMRRFGVLCVIIIFAVQLYAQNDSSLKRLMMVHDSVYDKYRSHADTVTRNSWLNIMQTNRYLSLLHYYDSLIQVEYADATLADSANMVLNRQLHEFQSQIKYLKTSMQSLQVKAEFYRKMYLLLIALSLVFLAIILALAVVAGRTGKKLNIKDQLHKRQYTEMHEAQMQIEESRKTENQMASEINRLKKLLGQSDTVSHESFRALQDEKLMLENQILEIKKAFEIESQKRLDAESLNQKVEDIELVRTKYEELLGEQSDLVDDLESMIDRLKNKLNLE